VRAGSTCGCGPQPPSRSSGPFALEKRQGSRGRHLTVRPRPKGHSHSRGGTHTGERAFLAGRPEARRSSLQARLRSAPRLAAASCARSARTWGRVSSSSGLWAVWAGRSPPRLPQSLRTPRAPSCPSDCGQVVARFACLGDSNSRGRRAVRGGMGPLGTGAASAARDSGLSPGGPCRRQARYRP
jgi:hypothetical protein